HDALPIWVRRVSLPLRERLERRDEALDLPDLPVEAPVRLRLVLRRRLLPVLDRRLRVVLLRLTLRDADPRGDLRPRDREAGAELEDLRPALPTERRRRRVRRRRDDPVAQAAPEFRALCTSHGGRVLDSRVYEGRNPGLVLGLARLTRHDSRCCLGGF